MNDSGITSWSLRLSLHSEESDFCAIVHDSAFSPRFNISKKVKSNQYKMTTFGTTQKWLSWKGGRLIKNLYQETANQNLVDLGRF